MRIDVAYCVELDKVIDIYEACYQYSVRLEQAKAAGKRIPTRFNFLCSDPRCRVSTDRGVRVIGVNHHKSPEEQELTKSAHFRVWDTHIADCEWVELNDVLTANQRGGDNKEFAQQRQITQKVTRLITQFDPVDPDDIGIPANNPLVEELECIRRETDPVVRRQKREHYASGTGSKTSSLEALVSCYEELKGGAALYEQVRLPGNVTSSYQEIFRHFSSPQLSTLSVWYGGARLHKRYGDGFALRFLDRYNALPVSLYVSPDDLKKFPPGTRLKRMVDELEDHAARRPYLKVYWLGGVQLNDQKYYDVKYSTLAHLVFRMVFPQT
ncbi:hypothetical protein ACSV5M_21555 [Cellvibrio sp. ARAG 10.3]|uniref:hypothetical protein n=1 Tax=Cellvibrio sp. ARAG 10.3 TaxID=3451358 RepID=UPI003F476712